MNGSETAGNGATVSADELVARARALVPILRERQEACERERRVPNESVKDMLAADLYRTIQPKSYGGFEQGLDDFVRIAAEIGAGCGSTSWVYATGAQHQWHIGMFPRQAQEDVWGQDRNALAASSYNPAGTAIKTDGGYRLSGNWGFCSGVDNAQWMILGVRVAPSKGADPTGQGYVLVPQSDYSVDDTWHVLGLAGTGSKNVILDDVFIPAHRMLTLEQALSGSPPGAEINPGPLFKVPFFAAISICLCAPCLGMAQGALEDYLEGTRQRVTRGAALATPQAMGDYPTIQIRVAEAAAAIEAARGLVLRDCADIMATMEAGKELTEAQRARNKGDLGYAVKTSKHAVDLLFESAGGQGLYTHNRLQRTWRDIHAGAKHISTNWDAVGTLYGRILLGRPAGTAQF